MLAAPIVWAANWPQWRGPSADGISLEKNVPVEWSAKKNIAWKIPLAGLGTSTPIVWDDRIFLTSQIGDGPYEGRSRDFENASVARRTGARDKVRFVVQALSRRDGHVLWEYEFDADGFMQPVHIKHNMASPSCVTDGELLYAWMGTGQLVALTLDGKEVWKRHLGKEYGPFEILWGHGSSPTIYKHSLILLCDHQGQAYLLSLDKKSGKQIWKVERGKDRRSYSTPFVIPGPQGDELVVNSSERIDVFDPATGKPLWHVAEENRVPVPSPVFHNGIIYTSRGYSSGPYMAVTANGRVVWEVKTGAPYVSSLLYYDGLLYMATETGIASCVDAATGKTLWKERFGGVFSASPVAANGKVYLVNETGETFVLEAGRELKILYKNVLAERTLASPAVSGGQIFLRTDEHLIAIGAPALSSQLLTFDQGLFADVEQAARRAVDLDRVGRYGWLVPGVSSTMKGDFTSGAERSLTQAAEGSWFVKTRALSLQPHLDAGFPYGKKQFVSAAGTSWAAMALMSGAQQTPP